MASISKKIGTITARTSTGSQAITGLGFAPRLLILWTNNQTADGTAADACLMAQGMSDGSTSAWAAYYSKDNQSTSKARSSHNTTSGKIIGFADGDGTLIFEVGLTSFDSDGFTLNYTTVDGVARIIQYLAIGGSGQFKVGTNTSPVATGLQTISGVGFHPTGCIFLCPRVPSGTQTQTTANFSYGFSDSGGQQVGHVVYSCDGYAAGTIDCGRRAYTDLCMQAMNNTPSGVVIARHSSYNGDGLVLNWTNVEATAWRYIYCCIGKLKCRVQEDVMRTTTGNQSYTGTGFLPSVLLMASSTINGWYSENLFSNGAAVSTSQRFALSSADQYHANPTNGHEGQSSTKVLETRYTDTFSVIQAADLVSFDSDGYTVNFSTINGNADKIESMTIGETAEETKVVAYGENLNEQSTTQTGDQDALAVTLNAEANATYLVIATWQCNENQSVYDVRAKLVNATDAVTYQSMNWEPSDTTDYPAFMALGIFANGASPQSKTFKIQYSTELITSSTAKIKNARIIILKKGAEDQTVEDTGRITTTAATDTDATTLTFTPGSAGWYLLLAGADVDNSSTTPRTRAILEVDGTNKVTSEIHVSDTTTVWSWGAMAIAALSKASHSIKIQYSTSTATTTTAGIQRRRIFALRLDRFLNAYFDNSTATSRTTNTSGGYVDKASLTRTPVAGEHLVIAGQTIDENSTTISVYSKLLDDASDINEALKEPSNAADRFDYIVAYQESLAASSKTWKLQYKTETAATAAGAAESAIVVLQFSVSSSPSHSTDAALKGGQMLSHTTDADLKESQTIAHATDALKKATSARSHGTDACLKKAQTAAHTTDADKKGARTANYTTDADLRGTRTVQYTSDARLKGTKTAAQATDSDLKGATTKVHATDALLRITKTRAHSSDALLKARASGVHQTDARLRYIQSIQHGTDGLLRKTFSAFHGTDSLLRATDSIEQATDALLRAARTLSHGTDADLLLRTGIAHLTDALLRRTGSLSHATDSLLRSIRALQHATDSLLRETLQRAHTSDALLRALRTASYETDALLRNTLSQAHETDALLRAVRNVQHMTDAYARLTSSKGFFTDALLRMSAQRAHSVDALIKATNATLHASDALIRATSSATHQTDALLQETFEESHRADALLLASRTTIHTSDTLLQSTETPTHGTDAILRATISLEHATSVLLRAARAKDHLSDALLRAQQTAEQSVDSLLQATVHEQYRTDSLLRKAENIAQQTGALLRETSDLAHGTDALLVMAVSAAGKFLGAFSIALNDVAAIQRAELNDVFARADAEMSDLRISETISLNDVTLVSSVALEDETMKRESLL